ncbi:uncharacterized protein TRUGW13939_01961 [Talaromyces rugulosus]|uniref:Uncharacterized protein n=1 Tax=Talaromyces rugulosus TaxID=121627 RepID=A0A7H8QMV1_TALRU|nr:uncharacterized protein TRUGW13939_01961 [Talaromyces rugulosus]QKX54871.1 hypothetical protein TRUGW13939_01961 [Talaromyces rugulosus]
MPGPTYQSRSHSSATTSSDASEHSKSTAPTVYSHRPVVKQEEEEDSSPFSSADARSSSATYASTVSSSDDLPKQPRYEVAAVADRQEVFPSSAIPSNPASFADLFPSARRLLIRHDDSTLDGNMNLRVDTMLMRGDRMQQQKEVTLFHLRMHDLRSRVFSLRRYCRDSGREVCHCRRLSQPAPSLVPVLRRSWSVLSGLRPGSSGGKGSVFNRYSLAADEDAANDENNDGINKSETLSNTMLLEFSNYARVELSRTGVSPLKRYEFEYWRTRYQWRRESRREGDYKEISYHLVNLDTAKVVAHIVPEVLTPTEMVEEESKGGWVPPCSLWISDASAYEKMHDIADVILATGIIALADDSIRRRWHSKRHLILNLAKKPSFMRNMDLDSLGARRFIDEMFHRRGSAS